MLRFLSLSLTLCFLTLTATAAQAFDNVECGAIEEQVTTVLGVQFNLEVTQSAASQSTALPDGCAVTALDIYYGPLGLPIRAERLVFSGDGLMAWVRGDVVLPRAVSATLEGVSLADGATVPPNEAWIDAIMGRGAIVDLRLILAWDEAAQALEITDLTAEFDAENRLSLRGAAITDGSWQANETPLSALGVLEAEIDLLNNGLIRTAIIDPLVANGTIASAESTVFLGAGFAAMVDNAPDTVMSPASQAELGTFLRALPAAEGLLRLRFASPVPVLPERVAEGLRSGLPLSVALPPGATITATWTPSTR